VFKKIQNLKICLQKTQIGNPAQDITCDLRSHRFTHYDVICACNP